MLMQTDIPCFEKTCAFILCNAISPYHPFLSPNSSALLPPGLSPFSMHLRYRGHFVIRFASGTEDFVIHVKNFINYHDND